MINYDIHGTYAHHAEGGRINRVDTKHDQVHTYTFFPTINPMTKSSSRSSRSEDCGFYLTSWVGCSSLTDSEEVEAHSLFSELSKETIEGQDEPDSELKYLQEIRLLRDENPAP